MTIAEIAYAKINLALHVRGRRDDGYHEIETLFAFVDDGDRLNAASAGEDRVTVTGEFAGALDNPFDNIVARALNLLPRAQGWAVTLEKRLPVAAGLGGGSADAGALLRMMRAAGGLPDGWEAKAARLGADVPACVESRTAIGRGIGTALTPVENDLAGMKVLLVNPRIAVPTGAVYARWDGIDRGGLPDGPVSAISRNGRNDLEQPAIALCPAIAGLLADLGDSDAWLVRMSGSGASCFALYETAEKRDAARAAIAGLHPGAWLMEGSLR